MREVAIDGPSVRIERRGVNHQMGLMLSAGLAGLALIVLRRFLLDRRHRSRERVIVGVFAAACIALVAFVGSSIERGAAPQSKAALCASRLRHLAQGLMMYAQDHGDQYPPCGAPLDTVRRVVRASPAECRCPSAPGIGGSYAMNRYLDPTPGGADRDPAVPLVFDSDGRGAGCDGVVSIAFRHNLVANVVTTTGNLLRVASRGRGANARQIGSKDDLRWVPSAPSEPNPSL